MRKSPRVKHYADIRSWVKIAVAQEEAKPPDPLWKGEPSEAEISKKQRKRIRFLRKHGKVDPRAKSLAERLQSCHPRRRCLSGACLQCGRLLQRWFVRGLKRFIADHLETQKGELIAICMVPSAGWATRQGFDPPIPEQDMRLKVNGRRSRHAAFRSLLSIGLMRQPITEKMVIRPEPAA